MEIEKRIGSQRKDWQLEAKSKECDRFKLYQPRPRINRKMPTYSQSNSAEVCVFVCISSHLAYKHLQTHIEWKKKNACAPIWWNVKWNSIKSTWMLTVLFWYIFCEFVIFQNKNLEKIRLNIKDPLAHHQMYHLS